MPWENKTCVGLRKEARLKNCHDATSIWMEMERLSLVEAGPKAGTLPRLARDHSICFPFLRPHVGREDTYGLSIQLNLNAS